MVTTVQAEQRIYEVVHSVTAVKLRVVCAWCPGFDPLIVQGASHGICPACKARMDAELDKQEEGDMR